MPLAVVEVAVVGGHHRRVGESFTRIEGSIMQKGASRGTTARALIGVVMTLVLLASLIIVIPQASALTNYDDPLTTSSVRLTGGTSSFSGLSTLNKRIDVEPGGSISGTVNLQTTNNMAASNNAPLIGTTSWGDHDSSHWGLNNGYGIATGTNSYSSSFTRTAPSTPGTYYIIFAFNAEYNGTSVASCTSWRHWDLTGQYSWNDGNDVASLSADKIAQLNTAGRTTVTYLHADDTHSWNQDGWSLPGDAITVVVSNPGDYQSPFTSSYLKLESGTGSFLSISPTIKQITVEPGATLSGTVKMEARNDASGENVPLIGTTSWGPHSSSYWAVRSSISTGTNDFTTDGLSLTAPQADGTYYLIFAFSTENDAAHVASFTNWRYGSASWNDGNDAAGLSSSQVAEAQANGRLTVNYLFDDGYRSWTLPVDVIKVVVDSLTHYSDPLTSSYVRIQSGTGSFASLSTTSKQVTVQPGGALAGSVTMSTRNELEPSDYAPLIGTPNWGAHSTSFWTINGKISTGTASYTSNGISLTAPQIEGTYYIVFAFNAEMEGDQVASCTNWRYEGKYGAVLWDNGNDVAELSNNQLAEAQTNGRTTVQYQFQSWQQSWSLPADAIKIVVTSSPVPDPDPDPLPTEETGVLAGTIVDTTGDPISGVTVELDSGQITATRADGSFAFSLTAGKYMVTLTKDGYNDKQMLVTVDPGSTYQLGEVSISKEGTVDPVASLPAWLPIAFVIAAAAAIIAILVLRKVR